MQSPSTNLLIPSLKNVPLTLYGNIEFYLGFSDFYDAIGYPCEGRSAIDHFSGVIRQRFPDPECRFFNLEVSVEPQKLKVSVSNCDGNMMVFKEPFLADKDLVRHFLNITTHQGISSIFNICDLASMKEAVAFSYYGGFESYEELKECDPELAEELSLNSSGTFETDVEGAFSGCLMPANCTPLLSVEKLKPYGIEAGLLKVIDELSEYSFDNDCDDECPIEPIYISSFGRNPHCLEMNYLECQMNYIYSNYGYSKASEIYFELDKDPIVAASQFDWICGRLSASANCMARFLSNIIEPLGA